MSTLGRSSDLKMVYIQDFREKQMVSQPETLSTYCISHLSIPQASLSWYNDIFPLAVQYSIQCMPEASVDRP